MKIGVVGTGRMGTAIARRLVTLGHEVRVWNRTAGHAGEALSAGAQWSPTPADLVSRSETVIAFLYDDEAVERVYFGAGGLLEGGLQGRLVIDMGTVSPTIHERIARALAASPASFVECPVSGSTPAALSGALVGFAGGDAPAYALALPLLGQLCRRVDLVGPVGAGARMKLASNLLLAVFWQALGEALLLADPPPSGRERTLAMLADSNIGAGVLRTRAAEIVAALDGKAPARATFDVDALRKDLNAMIDEAASHRATLPLASRTLECLELAAREGLGGLDAVAYPAYWVAQREAA